MNPGASFWKRFAREHRNRPGSRTQSLVQELRRPAGHARRHAAHHAGRPQGHHRPERRRQDHAVQPHYRHLSGDVRTSYSVRPGRHQLAEPPAHRARHGAHLPGHQPVPEIDRARQRAAGDQGPAAVEIRDVALFVLLQRGLRQGLSSARTSRLPRPQGYSKSAIFRTANSASSRSSWASPAIRKFCCSTSRPPACPRANPPR